MKLLAIVTLLALAIFSLASPVLGNDLVQSLEDR